MTYTPVGLSTDLAARGRREHIIGQCIIYGSFFLRSKSRSPVFLVFVTYLMLLFLFQHFFSVIFFIYIYASCVDAAVFMTMKLGVLIAAGL